MVEIQSGKTQKSALSTIVVLFLPIALFCQTPESDQKVYHELKSDIAGILQKTKVVGVSVAIISNYEVVWTQGFGLTEAGTKDSVTTQTLFQAASITKSLVAATVVKAYQDGKLDLDADVNKYLGKWKVPILNGTKSSFITLRQLLGHTAGVSGSAQPFYKVGEKIPTIVEALSGKTPAKNGPITVVNAPGRFSYSSAGYAILQQVLEDVEKQGLEAIVGKELFVPLGMSSSTFSQDPKGRFTSVASGHLDGNKVIEGKYFILQPLSFGGLWTTAADLATFLVEMQLSMEGRSNKVLSKENVNLMVNPAVIWNGSYGLGFSKEVRGAGVKFFGHDGHNYGYICSMIGSVKGGLGLVVMTNSENGWKAVNQIKKLVGRKCWGF